MDTPWKSVTALAERTRGVVTYDDLRGAGLSEGQVRRCVADGRLVDGGYGVFRVGGVPPGFEAEVLSAIAQFPGETWASHHTAARLHDLRIWSPDPRIELTRPVGLSAARSLARVHRTSLVLAHHLTHVRGIRCTTVPRTAFDLARTTGEQQLKRGIDRGLNAGRCTMGALFVVLYELGGPGRPGTRRMRTVLLDLGRGHVPPASELEAVGMALLAGLGFEWQVPLSDEQGYIRRVDGLHRASGLVVELDGPQHGRDPQRSLDVAGDRRLRRLGLEVSRLVWDDVAEHGPEARQAIVDLIAARGSAAAA